MVGQEFMHRSVAQLVARTAGGREVAGSSPVTPTKDLLLVIWHYWASPDGGASLRCGAATLFVETQGLCQKNLTSNVKNI